MNVADHGSFKDDALVRYKADIRDYPMLSREEETSLARRVWDEADPEAEGRLVMSHLKLVVKVAAEYSGSKAALLDLIQEGNVGLMQAVRKFDPDKGIRLASYATWWIRAYILKYLLDNRHIVKSLTSGQQKQLFFRLRKEKARLQVLGYEPTSESLAQSLDTTCEQVEKVERLLHVQDVWLDAPVSEEPGTRLVDLLSDNRSFEEDVTEQDFRSAVMRKVKELARTLPDKERDILHDRILADDPLPRKVLAQRFGLSGERIRQIENWLLEKLARFLNFQFPEATAQPQRRSA